MDFLIQGNIIHTPTKDRFEVISNGYLMVEDGKCLWISDELPSNIIIDSPSQCTVRVESTMGAYTKTIFFYDFSHQLIIPSFIDLHVHAPQYIQMGIGLDLPLIEWLNQYTFRNEERFANLNFAKKCYPEFVKDLYRYGTLRSVIFATIHKESNKVLVDEIHKKGLSALIGKVNMNRNAPVNLTEELARSLRETEEFIDYVDALNDKQIKAIITPRFAPSCTPDLLEKLGELCQKRHISVQSHLSENKNEIEWVKSLFKDELSDTKNTYSDVYHKYGLFGQEPTIMAHGVYLEESEQTLIKENNVFIAHCPTSNNNLSSGIMPLTRYLDQGLSIGLGSDIGAGHTLAMNQVIVASIAQAKILSLFKGDRMISDSEAFYIGTRGNGTFFEKVFDNGPVGCFAAGAPFDALVIGDSRNFVDFLTPQEQLQRFLHCGTPEFIKHRFLNGKRI